MIQGDSELLERWATVRDADAFKILSKRHAAMVFATCRRILGNDTDAEDIAQDCFVALVHAGSKPGTYLGPWLHKVATNLAIKHLRTESRRKGREAELHTRELASPSTPDDTLPLIDQAIAELPEKLRLPLVAYYLEDKTHEAIAKHLGITRQGAAYRIQKGVDRVRKSLKRKGALISGSALAALLAEETAHAVPPSLSAALGKLALQGAGGPATLASSSAITVARAATGVLAMKAKSSVTAGACFLIIASVIAILTLNRNPESTDTPSRVTTTGTDVASELPTRDQAESPESEPVASVDGTPDDSPDPTATPLDQSIGKAASDGSEPKGDSQETLPDSHTISGYVLDDGGFPIAGAKVVCPGHRLQTTTDSSGQYTISGIRSSGHENFSASAMGFASVSKRFTLSSGPESLDRNFILSPGATLLGRVVTSDGRPVSNAVVQVVGHAWDDGSGSGSGGASYYGIAQTEADGGFLLGLKQPSQIALNVRTPSNGKAIFTSIPVGLPEPIELRMEAAPSLTGAITFGDERPGSSLVVRIEGRFDMPWFTAHGEERILSGSSSHYRESQTDASGGYFFPDLTANSTYSVSVRSIGGADLSPTVDLGLFGPGETRSWDYTLPPVIRVRGKVTGEQTGLPITNYQIFYIKDGVVTDGPTVWDNEGYEISLFEPGTYTIVADDFAAQRENSLELYGKEVTLSAGEDRELNFQLPDMFTLSVQVVDGYHTPIEGATLDWSRSTSLGESTYGKGQTDAEGRHSNAFVPFYDGWFRAHHEGYTSARTTRILGEPGVEYPEEIVTPIEPGASKEHLWMRADAPWRTPKFRFL